MSGAQEKDSHGEKTFRGPRVRMGIHWAVEGTVANRSVLRLHALIVQSCNRSVLSLHAFTAQSCNRSVLQPHALIVQSCNMRNMVTLCVPFLTVITKDSEQQAESSHAHRYVKPLCGLALTTEVAHTSSSRSFTFCALPRCSLHYMLTCRVVSRVMCITHICKGRQGA